MRLETYSKSPKRRFSKIMGILNITPDSFHADSRVDSIEDALVRAKQMIEDGADWLDIGGDLQDLAQKK